MKVMQEKKFCHGYEGWIEKSVTRDHSVASVGKPLDARQWSSGRIFFIYPLHPKQILIGSANNHRP